MDRQNLLLFGDQTTETLESIKNLVRQSKKSPYLQKFLRDATDVVQLQSSKLVSTERQRFFAFDTILDLAEDQAKQSNSDDLLATVLSYTSRLGELIIYVENDPTLFGTSSPVHALGLCTGLLPAAALAASRSTNELLRLGIEILHVLFRLALETTRRSRQIEEAPGCWGFVVTSTSSADQQAIIDEFHKTQEIPPYRHAYISVVSQSWTTVCGPPTILEDLFAYSPVLRLAPKLRLPVGAAVHARHLPRPDISRIIGASATFDMSISSKIQIMSTSSSKVYNAQNLRTLLHQMIEDITQNTLYLTNTVKAIVANLPYKDKVTLTVVGPTSHMSLVVREIESQNIKVDLIDQAEILPADCNVFRGGSGSVAIVGMSGRFPGGENVNELWNVLQSGKDVYQQIPKSRFDLQTYFDPTGAIKNSIGTQYGCFLNNPGHFDNRLFNVSPREAAQMDPMQRLLLMSSYEALEMAGYNEDSTLSTDRKRIATYFGQAADDQREISHSEGIDMYYVPGLARAFAPGRLNYHYKWEGASYSLDSACASSSSAVLLAYSALIARECDTALAGGGSILNTPHAYSGLSRGGFLSPTGGCKTFQEGADGYCRGEGVGVVVLKRLEDAIADNDNIHAVIRATARNYSAHASSITHPHAQTQERLYRQVLQQSAIAPHEISYVEMHGTATQAGDVCEMTSVTNVFANDRPKENPLYVGAVKASIGHGEAAAGVTALIKIVMMLREDLIPPQPGMSNPLNSKFPPLSKINVHIPDRKKIFKRLPGGDGKRKVLLNNFDAAGGNSCFIIEDAPGKMEKEVDERSYHVVTCSARTLRSFKANKQHLLEYLDSNPHVALADLAYTTTARRMHDVFRGAYPASSVEDVIRLLKSDLANTTAPKRTATDVPIIFTFTGQGSQYAGMGKELFLTSPRFRDKILKMQTWCDWLGFPSFLDIIVNNEMNMKRKKPVQVQLAVFALEIALADMWKSWGVKPDLVIGHSLGEYAALCTAGVLSMTDAMFLVGKRAILLQEKLTSGAYAMLSTVSAASAIQEILDTNKFPGCQISCFNTPTSTVVSGKVKTLEELQTHLQASGVKTTVLGVPFGFHSAQLDTILPELEEITHRVLFAKPVIPVASTFTGRIVREDDVFTPEYMVRQAREPVDFIAALQACKDEKLADDKTLWIEIGPNAVCNGLVRSTLDIPSPRLLSALKPGENSWKLISRTVAAAYTSGVAVNWPEFHKDYVNALTLLELPTYSFDVKDYWTSFKEILPAPAESTTGAPVTVSMPGFPTTTLQRVESETISRSEISVIFSSKTAEPQMYDAIQGHVVNGTPICPSSVFADMALTAAIYVQNKAELGKKVSNMSLEGLNITHPLVVPACNSEQSIILTAVSSASSNWAIEITFQSKDGKSSSDHGGCRVVFGNPEEWKAEWGKHSWFVKARMDAIINSAKFGQAHQLLRPIVYKLFGHVVRYSDRYQGLEEVFLDNAAGDSVAKVQLQSVRGSGTFTCNPYWSDSIVHLAGFVLNGNITTPEDTVFISGGLGSMRISEELSADKRYTSYVRMQPAAVKGYFVGDVYVFDGDNVVAMCSDLMFLALKKNILNAIIGNHSSSAAPARTPSGHSSAVLTPNSGSSTKNYTSTPASSTSSVDGGLDMAGLFMEAVAAETGIDLDEIEPSSFFSDMGVDSLMSIAIIDAIKKETGVVLPASFLNEYPTVADMKRKFEKTHDPMEAQTSASPTAPLAIGAPTSPPKTSVLDKESFIPPPPTPTVDEARDPAKPVVKTPIREASPKTKPVAAVTPEAGPKYSSNVVLLHGRPSSDQTPLFLIADGAGSATAYIHLPSLQTGLPVYALESPFLHCPNEYACSIEEIADIFKAAIHKTRPRGPYMIGGWSAGAVYAYEVSRRLLDEGEKILGLILLDMRVPRPMPDALEPNMELLEQAGLITGIKRAGRSLGTMSQKLKQHLLSTVKALMVFDPVPMHPARRPAHTVMIWAKIGMSEVIGSALPVADEPEPEGNIMEDANTGLKSWFYAKRRAFGPNGWDKLVGDVECHAVDADHFSMVAQPQVKTTTHLFSKYALTLFRSSSQGL
ncbi:putative polyketide synthase [Stipitochalara longipes BDJ]|nr:putative polyketide synthase [Stipitochalara longipes BDJ]